MGKTAKPDLNCTPVELDAGLLFSGKASGTMIRGYDRPCAYTPQVNPSYIFSQSVRDVIVWLLNPTEPLYIYGPSGSGKTSCVKQLAARLNYPVFEITCHSRLEFADLVGHLTVHKGDMEFEYGPLALAMLRGGIFLLNEIDLIPPDIATGLNGILDGSSLCVAENGGELIQPHPMFRFVATANTNGGGDDTGLYQGTQRQNLAFADRFILCEMGYPDAEVEKQLLEKHVPELPASIRETMVNYANEVRRLFMGDGQMDVTRTPLEITFSTRSLLRWADLTVRFQALARQGIQPVAYALDRALAFRASRESRAMLHELVQRMFPQSSTDLHIEPFAVDESDLTGENGTLFLATKMRSVSQNGKLKVCLRKKWQGPDGEQSKDWIAVADDDGLILSFGRTGNRLHDKHYLKSDCINCDPYGDLQARAARKMREGYAMIIPECEFE